MPRQLIRTLIVDLPDDIDEAAKLTMISSEPWKAMIDALNLHENGKVKFEHKTETMETRARVERAPRKARANGAVAKAEPVPGLVV